MSTNLRKFLLGLGAGFSSLAALLWWLIRYEPVKPQAYVELASLPAGGQGSGANGASDQPSMALSKPSGPASPSLAGLAQLPQRINRDHLRRDTEALSAIPVRRAGQPGEAQARAWVLAQFKAAGLQRVRLIPVVYPHWRLRGRSELSFFTPAPYHPDFVVLSGSASTPADGLEARLVDVGAGSEVDYAIRSGRGLDGAVHLITQPDEPRRDLVLRATRYGAVAVVLAHGTPSAPGRSLIENGTGVSLAGRIPALSISHEAGQHLRQCLAGDAGLPGKSPAFGQPIPGVRALLHVDAGYELGRSANVVGELPGQSNEYVALAAHYDAWYAGAADNAAGLACLLELARIWTASDLHPRRAIRFVSYAAEEAGLMGSLFEAATRAPLVKARCRGVVSPDVVGVAGGALRFGADPPALAEAALRLAQQLGYVEATGYPLSTAGAPIYADHWPFARLRLPALVVSKGPDPFYHTPYDTAERLDYEDLRWTAAVVGAVALRLAELS